MVIEKISNDKNIIEIKKSLSRIDNTLDRQAYQLETHIKRTTQLEEHFKDYDEKFIQLNNNISKEIPMLLTIIKETNNNQIKMMLKLLTIGGTCLTVLITIVEFIIRMK